jgi:hypothetical protein
MRIGGMGLVYGRALVAPQSKEQSAAESGEGNGQCVRCEGDRSELKGGAAAPPDAKDFIPVLNIIPEVRKLLTQGSRFSGLCVD